MAAVYLGLGSNINAAENLQLGVTELRRRFGELELSDTYQSAAVGFEGDDFLNLVVGLQSNESPADIHQQIEAIHEMVGRQRRGPSFSSRPLDIDLLLYDDLILDEPPVRLPRADILEYSFVLRPIAELAPVLVHPVTRRTLSEHWQAFDKESHPLVPVSVIL
ncbi:MAG: 2-amino-4-hydroxy-6-hydroxymethyldihydropteridine diphosphokinase [Gammaproteobacteria bacterium]|nr:2-amino-4-hydroxy-6-hydroxymethyldihydropteridine diphosphokinase [Gammaproteobacteria bacterium]MDH3805074.1 2-amino-4-hydroxy-6-hydroxymethyldihydropteridine diphosphokinase [Gammaproteobacteria bacterium]